MKYAVYTEGPEGEEGIHYFRTQGEATDYVNGLFRRASEGADECGWPKWLDDLCILQVIAVPRLRAERLGLRWGPTAEVRAATTH